MRTYLLDQKITADNSGTTEPVTVAELKTYLQNQGTAYDGPLDIFIKAARKKIENYCNVSLVPKAITLTFKTNGFSPMRLLFGPVATVTSVEHKDCCDWEVLSDGATPSDYCIQSQDSTSWEIVSTMCGQHRIKYTTEAPDDMDIYKQAILMQAGALFTFRDDATFEWSPAAKMLLEEMRNLTV